MTCRERLLIEHPEDVRPDCVGGCRRCPQFYGYVTEDRCLATDRKRGHNKDDCTECWNQTAIDPPARPKPVKDDRRRVAYISGPITGVEKYWEAFESAEDELSGRGWTVLSPTRHPVGLTNAQYMRMDLAMIDSADAVFFLPGWENSAGARLEKLYCEYIQKPHEALTSTAWRR